MAFVLTNPEETNPLVNPSTSRGGELILYCLHFNKTAYFLYHWDSLKYRLYEHKRSCATNHL